MTHRTNDPHQQAGGCDARRTIHERKNVNYSNEQMAKKSAYAQATGLAQQNQAGAGAILGGMPRTATEALASPIEQQMRRCGAIGDQLQMLRKQLEERLGEVLAHPQPVDVKSSSPTTAQECPLSERICMLGDFLEAEANELQQLLSRIRC